MKKLMMTLALTPFLVACGEAVEVPPAHVGKILAAEGFRDETIPPSKFRLPVCWAYCDKLILVEASDGRVEEQMRLFMPVDQLNLTFDIRATIGISKDARTVASIFDRVSAGDDGLVTLGEVYAIYGRQQVRSVTREVLAQYSIEQVAGQRSAINARLFKAVTEALAHTPLSISHLALADIQYPDVIVKAKELAKEREIEIERAQAERQVALVKAEAELELAKKDRLVRLEKARTIKEENDVVAASVTSQYLEYRRLEVMEAMAASGSTVFFPADMLDSIGLQTRVFSEGRE